MQAYMKSQMPYRGVTRQPLTALLRPLYDEHRLGSREEWESCVRLLWDGAAFREERYAATALTGHRFYRDLQDSDSLPLYSHLVETGAWWDHVDELASRRVGPVLDAHPEEVTPTLRRWCTAEDIWLRRTAIICQLQRKERTDLALLREAVEANLADSRFGDEFFIRKAIGWALRQHARIDPDWVRAFVAEHEQQLSGLSRREALKHL